MRARNFETIKITVFNRESMNYWADSYRTVKISSFKKVQKHWAFLLHSQLQSHDQFD